LGRQAKEAAGWGHASRHSDRNDRGAVERIIVEGLEEATILFESGRDGDHSWRLQFRGFPGGGWVRSVTERTMLSSGSFVHSYSTTRSPQTLLVSCAIVRGAGST
jgi:hypothetical protein